jgi:hypothetical protein
LVGPLSYHFSITGQEDGKQGKEIIRVTEGNGEEKKIKERENLIFINKYNVCAFLVIVFLL